MPYKPALDTADVTRVGKYLLSLALRPLEAERDDTSLRFDRRRLWDVYGAESPAARWEDFFEALRQLADSECDEAVQLRTHTARRVHVILSRDIADWEPLLYDDTEDLDDAIARELLAQQGYDVARVLPDAHRIVPRVKVVHDEDTPRTCAACRESKPTSEFSRRGAAGTPNHGRFSSRCKDCTADYGRQWRATHPGYDQRDRHERRTGTRGHGLSFG